MRRKVQDDSDVPHKALGHCRLIDAHVDMLVLQMRIPMTALCRDW